MLMRQLLAHTFMTSLALSAAGSIAITAASGPRSYSDIQAVTISGPGQSAVSKSIIIPFNKSTTIDLPGGMMDVIVSNPNIVEAVVHTSERVLLTGKAQGQTNVFIYGHDGQEILSLEIRVERDLQGLQALIQEHAPGNSVIAKAYNNHIVLSGDVANAGMAKRIVDLAKLWAAEDTLGISEAGEITNLMNIKANDQVMLKVRIVEMQRSVTKQMGFNFSALGSVGGANLGLASSTNVDAASGFNGTLNWTNAAGGALRSISSQLQALETVGLVRTLAEPVLTTVSGETANFLSGGEFPLLTDVSLDENGNIVRQFEFKPFGVSLGFTPVVLSEGRISLNISTEVSEPSTENSFDTVSGNILGLRVRRANTVVELAAGSSMVIAGLIREESRQEIEGTPGLKDVPGLGALFRARDDQTTETELVIIVTPYLVTGTHPDKLQTPLDGYVAANDRDAALLGRLNKIYGKNKHPENEKSRLSGPFGHVVD